MIRCWGFGPQLNLFNLFKVLYQFTLSTVWVPLTVSHPSLPLSRVVLGCFGDSFIMAIGNRQQKLCFPTVIGGVTSVLCRCCRPSKHTESTLELDHIEPSKSSSWTWMWRLCDIDRFESAAALKALMPSPIKDLLFKFSRLHATKQCARPSTSHEGVLFKVWSTTSTKPTEVHWSFVHGMSRSNQSVSTTSPAVQCESNMGVS